MDIALDATASEWRDRAFRFATEELIPHEVEAELNEGRLPPELEKRHKKLAVELGFSAMDVPKSRGGLGLRIVDQVAVWEQLGRVTNALCWCYSEAQGWMFEACSEDQVRRFILPLVSGARKECYAITETGSGSDVVVETAARRTRDGYAISGEKWYVTSANHADYFILQAKLADGPHAGSDSLFFVDKSTPGIEVLRSPAFSHTFSAHHQAAATVCRSGRQRCVGFLTHWIRFAGQHRLVDVARSFDDAAVDGNLLAGPDSQPIADLHVLERDINF